MSASQLYIIIVTYNGMKWLPNCLSSIPTAYPVVIVDNNSNDGTPNYIKENYPQYKLFEESTNLGFGQANNKGIRYVLKKGAEAVFLLNQDAYLEEDTIEELIQIHHKKNNYGILSPFHYRGKRDGLDEKFLMFMTRCKKYKDYIFDANEGKIEKVYEVPFINAAGWFISKKCLETVGGFDPLFFHYGEDDNYCQRVLYHGFKIGIVPEAKMMHDRDNREEVELQKYSEQYYNEYEKSAKIYWADINLEDFESKFLRKLSYIQSKRKKALLSFNFRNAKDLKLKYKILKRLYINIQQSRKQNITPTASYL